jgi:nucleoside-diphosphate-sugar epimerase
MMEIRTVLVTGATGFIGPTVCRYLVAVGCNVRAVARRASIGWRPDGAIEFFECDLTRQVDYDQLLAGVDAVIHLAARVHVMRERLNDSLEEYRRVNVDATSRLAMAASERGVKRFVFLSSIKVNGEQTCGTPFSEDDVPNPQDPYGISKWEAERALHELVAGTGLGVVIIRPPLVYGPAVGANFLRMIRLVESGVPMPFRSIDNRRSIIFVDNLADAIVACLMSPAADGKTYLVSDSESLSTPQLLEAVARAMGRGIRLWHFPSWLLVLGARMVGRHADATRLVGSLEVNFSRIRSDLGWVPPFSTATGIERTVQWYAMTRACSREKSV